jgi:hypothetical protein
MQSVPRDLEDLVGRIAHAAEAMYPDLTVTWLPDAAGEQFVFMLSRAGGSGEIRVRWKTLRGAALRPSGACSPPNCPPPARSSGARWRVRAMTSFSDGRKASPESEAGA